jgi:hypothetical protein
MIEMNLYLTSRKKISLKNSLSYVNRIALFCLAYRESTCRVGVILGKRFFFINQVY